MAILFSFHGSFKTILGEKQNFNSFHLISSGGISVLLEEFQGFPFSASSARSLFP
jgi:hypothetical protein